MKSPKQFLIIFGFAILAFYISPNELAPGSYTFQIQGFDRSNKPITDLHWSLPLALSPDSSIERNVEHDGVAFQYQEVFAPSKGAPFQVLSRLPNHPQLDYYQGLLLQKSTPLSSMRGKLEGEQVTFTKRFLNKPSLVIALVVIVAGLWVTELIPIAATSLLIPIAANLFQLDQLKLVLGQFARFFEFSHRCQDEGCGCWRRCFDSPSFWSQKPVFLDIPIINDR